MIFTKSYLVPYTGYYWTKHSQSLTEGIFFIFLFFIFIFLTEGSLLQDLYREQNYPKVHVYIMAKESDGTIQFN